MDVMEDRQSNQAKDPETIVTVCTYCDEPATDKDHVPPKLLFPPPRGTMVTVPACRSCNGRFGRDDEYARLVFSVDHRTGDHASIGQLWPTVLRSLQKPEAPKFKGLLTNTLQPTLIQQKNGLVVPTGVFEADLARLKNWTARILRGLYRDMMGDRLPLDVYVRSIWEDDLRDMPPAAREQLGTAVIAPVLLQQEHVIQGGEFRYRLLTADGDRFSGVMLMMFYDALPVLVMFQSPEARRLGTNGPK
jgi:hypothetical protein